jgi:DNA-binding transcriptional ArsR family regulator
LAAADPRQRLAALEAVFGALAHAARRQMLLTVHFRGGSMTAGEIAGRFAHAWPTTTRHLRVLEDAGLLSHEKVGRTRVYRVDRARLDIVREWLAWFDRDAAEVASRTRRDATPPLRLRPGRRAGGGH